MARGTLWKAARRRRTMEGIAKLRPTGGAMAQVRERRPEAAVTRPGCGHRAAPDVAVRTVQRLAGNRAAGLLARGGKPGQAPAKLVGAVLSGTGSSLPPELSRVMGEWFGADVATVRVHHDRAADRAARAVGAEAFTVGEDIVFADGAYAPHSDAGRRALAHELTHVVQQRAGAVDGAPRGGLRVSSPEDRFERHAGHVAESFGRAARAPAGPGPGAGAPATVQRCGATPPEQCSCHEHDLPALQRQVSGGQSDVHASPAGVARPAGLPIGQGFTLYALPQVPPGLAAQLPEGQVATISLAQPAPRSNAYPLLESAGSGSYSGLAALNSQLRMTGLPGGAAGTDAIGLVAIPRTNMRVSRLDPRFNLPDPAAPLDALGHTAVYVRQGGRIVAVRGFNPEMGTPSSFLRMVLSGREVEAGTAQVPAVLSEDAYLFTSNAARSMEYPVSAEQAAAFLAGLPATGPGGRPGVPTSYTARPAVWAAENPGVAEPFCVASNCGLWAVERVEQAVGGPVGRAGQGTVTGISHGSTVPGTAGQGPLIGLLDEAAAAQAAGRASPLAQVPGAVGPAVAGRVGTVLRVVKIGGRVLLVVGIVAGAAEIYLAPPEQRGRVAAGVAGGFAGGFALGATAGLFCGPGALVCSIVAGLALGTIGAFGGRAMAESLYDEAHRPRDPREYPGHSVVCPGCHDNPATHADRFRVLSPGQQDLRPPSAPASRELSAADRAVIMQWLQSPATGPR